MKVTQICLAASFLFASVRAGALRQRKTQEDELELMDTCDVIDEEYAVSDACQDLVPYDGDLPQDDDPNNRKLQQCPAAYYFDAPIISFLSSDPINNSANDRVWFSIDNHAAFSDTLFAATTSYGPCGNNNSPSRTWVHFDTWENFSAQRIYGYCALTSGLPDKLWVALDRSEGHWIRMRIHDRRGGECWSAERRSNWVWLPAELGFAPP